VIDFPFTMAFQPIVDIVARRIVSHEALVRGPNGEGAGFVLARVNRENRYAFDQSCRVKAIELASRLGFEGNLSINFLPNAVYAPESCIRTTLEASARAGFPLNRITFEVVEQEDLADIGHLRKILAAYQNYGFRIALDDFGTAYSGLFRLAELKPDIVKLDRALIQGCDTDSARREIIASMVTLCGRLGVKLVLEGVETAGELAALREAGARYTQGFYFARPAFEAAVAAADIPWPDEAALA